MDARWNVRMYSRTFFMRKSFTHRRSYTHLLFTRRRFCTHRPFLPELWHSEPFAHRNFLHADTFTQIFFTHGRFYTQRLLQTNAFTHGSSDTQKFFHTEASTHSSCYTPKLFCTDAFTHGSFFRHRAAVATEAFIHTRWALLNTEALPQTFLHAEAFAHGSFYTQTFTYRSFCSQNLFHRCFYTQTLSTQQQKASETNTVLSLSFFNNAKQTLLHTKIAHTDAPTQNRFYTQKLLNRVSCVFFSQTAKSQFFVSYIESFESDFIRKGHVSRRNHFEPPALRYKKIRNLVLNLLSWSWIMRCSHLSENSII